MALRGKNKELQQAAYDAVLELQKNIKDKNKKRNLDEALSRITHC